jgi:murein DD-endopeptidase MepM/ murein hydrolase activator NlpD
MDQHRWTVVAVPHGSGTSRQIQVTRRGLKIIVGAALALFATAVLLMLVSISKSVDLSRLERLERRYTELGTELTRMHGVVISLTRSVDGITTHDRQVRLLAGLPARDPDVQQVGIGGPSGPMTEADILLSESAVGQQAIQTRETLRSLMRRAAFLAGSFDEAADSLAGRVDRLTRMPSIQPTTGYISSPFTSRRFHPIHREIRPHWGIDVAALRGTAIVAPAPGVVKEVKNHVGYGKVVTIDHGHGVVTRFAHCDEILVQRGQQVERNEEVARVGSTGIVTSAHLHYEILVNGLPVDPRKFIFTDIVD